MSSNIISVDPNDISLVSNQNYSGGIINATSPALSWSFSPIFSLIICITTIISNGTLLLLFAKDRNLRTPFTIYLIILLSANVLNTFIDNPLDIFRSLHEDWPLGYGWCSLSIYLEYFVAGGILYTHALISLNRTWALVFPISYRKNHSKKLALMACLTVWTFIHILLLPMYLNDALYYRSSGGECYLNSAAQPKWAVAIQFLIFCVPEVVILLIYVLILCKRKQKRVVAAAVAMIVFSDTHETRQRSRINNGRATNKEMAKVGTIYCAYPLIALSLLTASVIICWTPRILLETVATLTEVSDHDALFEVFDVIFVLQPIMDAIVFGISIPELRTAIIAIFRK